MIEFNKRTYFANYFDSLALSLMNSYGVCKMPSKERRKMSLYLKKKFFQYYHKKTNKTLEKLAKWTTHYS